jgi:hypothetical protein
MCTEMVGWLLPQGEEELAWVFWEMRGQTEKRVWYLHRKRGKILIMFFSRGRERAAQKLL